MNSHFRDFLGVLGLLLIAWGVFLFSRPCGFIASGLFLVILALFAFDADKTKTGR